MLNEIGVYKKHSRYRLARNGLCYRLLTIAPSLLYFCVAFMFQVIIAELKFGCSGFRSLSIIYIRAALPLSLYEYQESVSSSTVCDPRAYCKPVANEKASTKNLISNLAFTF